MTMLWPKTSTALHKNELIHTRMWNDVADVESATFDWANWWTDARFHQSIGYRTPTEIESELWSHQPAREIKEIKADAWKRTQDTSKQKALYSNWDIVPSIYSVHELLIV